MTFDDQFFKAVGGEASWKTSDFDRQPTVRHRLLARRRDVVVDTLELQVARGTQRLLAKVLFTERAPGGRRPAVAGAARPP